MIGTSTVLDELWGFLTTEQQQSMNRDAFNDIAQVYLDFIDAHRAGQPESIKWVCDAAPGHGKTTVLQCVLKYMAKNNEFPALIVFNNRDTMLDFYRELDRYATENEIPDLIIYIDTDNVDDYESQVFRHLYVCITQQRLRNLALGIGNWKAYSTYQPALFLPAISDIRYEESKPVPRAIIIDEMPILFNECVFDIGAENNAVQWFEELAKDAPLTDNERAFARNIIMLLILSELLRDEQSTTTVALRRHIEGTPIWVRFQSILAGVAKRTSDASPDAIIQYRWFERLLDKDAQGCIDRHSKNHCILCSERIDYGRLGNHLILDGTSGYTPTLYMGYTFKHVKDRNDYARRLTIHWAPINTTSNALKRSLKTIARSLHDIRESRGVNPVSLVPKSLIKDCLKNGIIAPEHEHYYRENTDESSDSSLERKLALNIFNTTGKNDLRQFSSLALIALPIRNAQFYKLKAIGIFGTTIDLSMATGRKNAKQWFKNGDVNGVFEELVIADLIQILLRTSLRNLEQQGPVQVYLYHNREEWNARLKMALRLSDDNFCIEPIYNDELYGFKQQCYKWIGKTHEYFTEAGRSGEFDSDIAARPSDIDKSFRVFLNKCYKNKAKWASLERMFREAGFVIYRSTQNNGERFIRKLRPEEK